MVIKSVMQVPSILMVVSGGAKVDIVCQAFTGKVTSDVPSSVLQFHSDVTIIGDKTAMSKLVEVGAEVS